MLCLGDDLGADMLYLEPHSSTDNKRICVLDRSRLTYTYKNVQKDIKTTGWYFRTDLIGNGNELLLAVFSIRGDAFLYAFKKCYKLNNKVWELRSNFKKGTTHVQFYYDTNLEFKVSYRWKNEEELDPLRYFHLNSKYTSAYLNNINVRHFIEVIEAEGCDILELKARQFDEFRKLEAEYKKSLTIIDKIFFWFK